MHDLVAKLKQGQKAMWALGDYSVVAERLIAAADALATECGIRPGAQVLDVAAGNGNFAVVAARAGAKVVACDITPRMIELGRARTEAEGLAVRWDEADAEELPYPADRFDVAASVFGVMFTPQPTRVVAELVRVTRPGGLIALANYSPQGFLPRLGELVEHALAAPPLPLPSHFLWGDEGELRRRFSAHDLSIRTIPRTLTFTFASVAEARSFWEGTSGPLALRQRLAQSAYADFLGRLEAEISAMNRATSDSVVLETPYLLALVRRPN
jgi:ubiquinone/menaquinone biosynthesis C-methylase UbiE